MNIINEYKHLFDPRVRKRGERYFLKGAVDQVRVDRNAVNAQIKGRGHYRTVIRFYPDHTPELACSCPFFKEWGDACKHLWALFMHVDSMVAEGELEYARLFNPENGNRRVGWKEFSRGLKSRSGPADDSDGRAAGFYPLYILDRDMSVKRGRLTFILREIYRRRNGRWGRQREFPRELNRDLHLTSEDRRILTVLFGQERIGGARFSAGGYAVTEEMYSFLIPLLGSTGRLRVSGDGTALCNLQVDMEAGWHFTAELRLRNGSHVLSGVWKVDGRRCRRTDLDALISGEHLWLLHENRLLMRDAGPAASWETSLFNNDGIRLSTRDMDEFMTHYNMHQDHMPTVSLPEAFQFKAIGITAVRPVAYLTFSHTKFWAEPACLYNEKYEFSGLRDTQWYFDVKRRVKLKRDRRREKPFLKELTDAGLTCTGDWYFCGLDEISQAVAALGEKGWIIYGEDRRSRIKAPSAAALKVTTDIDWFELEGTVDFDAARVPIARIIESLRKGSHFIELSKDVLGLLPQDWLEKYRDVLDVARREKEGYRISKVHVGALASLHEDPILEMDRPFEDLYSRIRDFRGIRPSKPLAAFKGRLRPYQEFGLGWLEFLDEYGFGGCLGDDMGLGKTVQLLAFLQKVKHLKKGVKALIVVPASIVFNWLNEAERFTPDLKVLPFWGGDRKRRWRQRRGCDIILTSYATMVRDIELLTSMTFDYVVFDEAQQLKNPWAKRTRGARKLKTRRRISLTGTPLENHLGDLWSQFSVLNPDLLGSMAHFKEVHLGADDNSNLKSLIAPFILRRTKQEVLKDLPPKVEEVLYCEMSTDQRAFYDEIRDMFRARIMNLVQEQGIERSRMNILEGLLRLRQICCYPGLADRRRRTASGKLNSLKEMIAVVVEEGHKALIFSQFTQMLGIIRDWVEDQGISYAYLDGQTRNREVQIKAFQEDEEIQLFLISLKAGGVGLNLTAADYVFLYDPWWNPAVENQAVDRAHRIGQKNTVFTYRFITRESIEEKILELQARKQGLIDNVVDTGEGYLTGLSPKDIEYLFS